jgi:hypothetical protein
VERLDDDEAARLERVEDAVGEPAHADVAEDNEIPGILLELELVVALHQRRQLDADARRFLLRGGHGAVRGVEAGHRPALLREIDRVAALAHADVERRAGLHVFHHLDEERVRLPVERCGRRGQDAIPELDLQARSRLLDHGELTIDFGGVESLRLELRAIQRFVVAARLGVAADPRAELLIDLQVGR